MAQKYDIFISYRREGGYDTAKHLNDLLVRDGYRVSFDIDTLRNGDFDEQLYDRIDQCEDFILIVDAHAFDRSLDPKSDPATDWLRCELAYALKKGKNIIPIFLSGVKGFPDNLPEDIHGVVQKNGPEYNRYYFNDFYETLKERFLHSKSIRRNVVMPIVAIVAVIALALLGAFLYSRFNHQSETEKSYGDTLVVHVVEKQKAEQSQAQPTTSPVSYDGAYRGKIGSTSATMYIHPEIKEGVIGYYYYNQYETSPRDKRDIKLSINRSIVNEDGTLQYELCEMVKKEKNDTITAHFDILVDTAKHTIKGRFYGNSGECKVDMH
jgi:hypothetical protein